MVTSPAGVQSPLSSAPIHFRHSVYLASATRIEKPIRVKFVRGISAEWIDTFNGWLARAVEDEDAAAAQLRLVRVAGLYKGRGEAHVEHAGEGGHSGSPRDCLHYCVAPGVLDALAQETLAALVGSE